MRKSAAIVVAVLAGLGLAAVAMAGGPVDKVTGGGQTLVGTHGAGNTIAFNAKGTGQDATGQVQVVDRTAGTGQSQVRFHGIVDCLTVSGNMAEILAHKRDDPADTFSIYVVDNGEGAAADNDLVFLNEDPESPCELQDDDDQGDVELARGNAQVYDAP